MDSRTSSLHAVLPHARRGARLARRGSRLSRRVVHCHAVHCADPQRRSGGVVTQLVQIVLVAHGVQVVTLVRGGAAAAARPSLALTQVAQDRSALAQVIAQVVAREDRDDEASYHAVRIRSRQWYSQTQRGTMASSVDTGEKQSRPARAIFREEQCLSKSYLSMRVESTE